MLNSKKENVMSKRERVKNFSEEEKLLLVEFVREHKNTLESKSSEPKINKKKKELWELLSQNMLKTGVSKRDANTLRSAYYRFKQQAKSAVGTYKRNLKKTGGGPGPSAGTEPSELDWVIADICPVDFEEDSPLLDCDDETINHEKDVEIFDGLVDPNTGEIIPGIIPNTNERPKREHPSVADVSDVTPKQKKRKTIPMTETQSKMVSLHERQINEKISKNNLLADYEMELVKTKLKNEEEIHNLKREKEQLKIENELKKKAIKDLKIQKLKLEIENLIK